MSTQKLVFLVGSQRKRGTSNSFSNTLKRLTEEKGHSAEIIYIVDYFKGKSNFDDLKSILADTVTIGLVMPLYVDFTPYPVLWFMEKLDKELRDTLKGKSFFAICQYGFPDIELGKPMLNSCRFFANELSMKWLGGLAYGGGAMINGKPLEKLGGTGKKLISCFDRVITDVLSGKPISPEIQKRIAVGIPKILYRPMAFVLNYLSIRDARKNGIRDIRVNPYREECAKVS